MTAPDLTILCVTSGEAYAQPFIAALHDLAVHELRAGYHFYVDSPASGCIERVLDKAISECPDGYVLRLDDDETCSPEMVEWLKAGEYRRADHWAFPRRHLYPTAEFYLTSPQLYPDLQTRLSLKQFAGGRTRIHEGSPHGTGQVAPVAIDHHKFLVRSLEERQALVERYEALQPNAGMDFRVFSVPEDFEGSLSWERVP